MLWTDDRTGEHLDSDGEPATPDPEARTIVVNEKIVETPWSADE